MIFPMSQHNVCAKILSHTSFGIGLSGPGALFRCTDGVYRRVHTSDEIMIRDASSSADNPGA